MQYDQNPVNTLVLWDRSLWNRPLLDRRVQQWQLGRVLWNSEAVADEDNLKFIKAHFLPELLHDLADIISGRRLDWSMPPDTIFIRSLESHLDVPVQLASAYILKHANKSKPFSSRVQRWMKEQDWTFVRTPHEEWACTGSVNSKHYCFTTTHRQMTKPFAMLETSQPTPYGMSEAPTIFALTAPRLVSVALADGKTLDEVDIRN